MWRIGSSDKVVGLPTQTNNKTSPTYLRDSQEAVESLRAMGALTTHARLFTSNATAMYTNIEPALGIASVKAWLSDYETEIPKGFHS
jgi:hypothetical protein